MTDFDLNPDGPHSPEHTAEAGQLFDDTSRFLVYATMSGKGGLKYPADAYRLAADLYSATGRFPQMCRQMTDFLRAQAATGRLYEARGNDVNIMTGRASAWLEEAAVHAEAFTRAMQAVQADIAGLGVRDGSDG